MKSNRRATAFCSRSKKCLHGFFLPIKNIVLICSHKTMLSISLWLKWLKTYVLKRILPCGGAYEAPSTTSTFIYSSPVYFPHFCKRGIIFSCLILHSFEAREKKITSKGLSWPFFMHCYSYCWTLFNNHRIFAARTLPIFLKDVHINKRVTHFFLCFSRAMTHE